ncbi:bacA [Symbiodinium sp. CCMP2592]|nr:bacA [Symbiodinium sp. CCMP2592]
MPKYLGHCIEQSDLYIAMTYVPGAPWDRYLQAEHKVAALENATFFVQHLLRQLAGAFQVLHTIALHRDVSSHNVQVAGQGRKWYSKCFVQVDAAFPTFHGFTTCCCGFQFGYGCLRVILHFSVEAEVQPEGNGGWKFTLLDFGTAIPLTMRLECYEELCGDGHYWCPGAWLAEGFTFRTLDMPENAQFKRQYMEYIDHYAVGIVCLESLFSLWHGRATMPGMKELTTAWKRYWRTVESLYGSPGFHEKVHSALLPQHQKIKKALAMTDPIPGIADLPDEMAMPRWESVQSETRDWSALLSAGERQRLAFARLFLMLALRGRSEERRNSRSSNGFHKAKSATHLSASGIVFPRVARSFGNELYGAGQKDGPLLAPSQSRLRFNELKRQSALSLGEVQQASALCGDFPSTGVIAVLDESTSAVEVSMEEQLYKVSHRPSLPKFHNTELLIGEPAVSQRASQPVLQEGVWLTPHGKEVPWKHVTLEPGPGQVPDAAGIARHMGGGGLLNNSRRYSC